MWKRLTGLFWRLVPHRHRWVAGLGTKYGAARWCARCGKDDVFMDVDPWGD